MRVIGLLVLAAAMCASNIAQAEVQFSQEGFLLVDGQPRLILGVYSLPSDAKSHEDALLQDLADHGFNLVCGGADKAVLDQIHAHGLRAWIPIGRAVMLGEDDAAGRESLIKTIDAFKNHPALLCWEGPDEALWWAFGMHRDWFSRQQPVKLKELVDKAAAEGKPNAEKAGRMLEEATDYCERFMWPEAEKGFAAVWEELGMTDPHPEHRPTTAIERVFETAEQFRRGWKVVRECDPNHVTWQNHAPCNAKPHLRLHNEGVHAAGCDIYPAPNYTGIRHSDLLPVMELTAVGAATDRMRDGAPGKSCWMVLQGFGWHDLRDGGADVKEPTDPVRGRRPVWEETQFMAYDALFHGANAILYWGTYKLEKDSALWKDLLRLGRELRALEPAIVAPAVPVNLTVIGEPNYTTYDGGDPKFSLRQVGDDWVLIAVNEWRTGVAFDLQGLPQSLEGKTLYRLYFKDELTVKNGGFHDGIRGHGAAVYATSRRFEAK